MAQADRRDGDGWLRAYLQVHPLPADVVGVRMPPRGSRQEPADALYTLLFWVLVSALSIGFWLVLFWVLRRYFGE